MYVCTYVRTDVCTYVCMYVRTKVMTIFAAFSLPPKGIHVLLGKQRMYVCMYVCNVF